jgi:cysteinyl-tRNA synthetase
MFRTHCSRTQLGLTKRPSDAKSGDMTNTPLSLFNSLTRQLEEFVPVHEGEARVYSCGPTVYNYQHIGNMRAYVFADTLGRVLTFKGYKLTHVINITDVGHLTSDADAGDDKMEKAASAAGKSAWDIAKFYQEDFEQDLDRLNVRKPAHPKATDYVAAMIEWGKEIADKHCYELVSGLYFDISTVPEYGRLARAVTDDGEGRIDEVDGKRNKADFAIWRKTPAGESRQMEWDSPWGRGAPGWHLECSVMSKALLGMPFDIHTGGIDHREIHHPNEIAQNQAHEGCADSGARIWMHNNFLVERSGKMSKSSGEFLRLQLLIDKGFHPLAYRLMCLQAHYRSELEFSWEGLQAAFVRLKRMVITKSAFRPAAGMGTSLKNVNNPQRADELLEALEEAISDDLNTAKALTVFEDLLASPPVDIFERDSTFRKFREVLGFDLIKLKRKDLRIRPKSAVITEVEIAAALEDREAARATKDFATSDRIRDDLIAKGVEVMDGDPLGWDWKLTI